MVNEVVCFQLSIWRWGLAAQEWEQEIHYIKETHSPGTLLLQVSWQLNRDTKQWAFIHSRYHTKHWLGSAVPLTLG